MVWVLWFGTALSYYGMVLASAEILQLRNEEKTGILQTFRLRGLDAIGTLFVIFWQGRQLLWLSCTPVLFWKGVYTLGIKLGFSCINIRQVPWEVLKTEAEGTWQMLMHWKTMFDRYYYIKIKNICYISRYFLHYFVSPFHWCLANAIFTVYARSRARDYTSHDGSNYVPWYRYIESCVTVH